MKEKTSQLLYAYWNSVRGPRAAPRRFEIEPSRIASLLPDTFILEREDDASFRFRLAGTRICESFGREFRAGLVDELWDKEDQHSVRELLNGAIQAGGVGLIEFVSETTSGDTLAWEMVMLPLCHVGPGMSRVLGAMTPVEEPVWLGAVPQVRQSVRTLSVIWPDGRPFSLAERAGSPPPFTPHETYSRLVTSNRRSFRVYDGGLSK